MTQPHFIVRLASWQVERTVLQAIRSSVFIEEQHVPEELEWDALDEHCHHALVLASDGTPVGTGRLLPDARIGRMAVLQGWRRRGAGSRMLMFLLDLARDLAYVSVSLHAQTHALGFYARHGFTANGEPFMEAGIPHRLMTLRLQGVVSRLPAR